MNEIKIENTTSDNKTKSNAEKKKMLCDSSRTHYIGIQIGNSDRRHIHNVHFNLNNFMSVESVRLHHGTRCVYAARTTVRVRHTL